MTSTQNEMTQQASSDAETEFHAALDNIKRQAQDDPLQGLLGMIKLMQDLNYELVKAYAPPLIEAAKNNTAVSRHEIKAIACLANLQSAITKLGMADIKVKNLLKSRCK